MKTRLITCLLSCLLVTALLSGCAKEEPANENTDASASVTFEASAIDGTSVSEEIFSESKITMVNVWATYCNPCLSEMPGLGELAGAYDPADFKLIGIISDVQEDADEQTLQTASDLIQQTGADYPHLLLNLSLYTAFLTDVSAVPTTFFVNQEGEVIDTVTGAMEKSAWEEKIDELLED
ncbi:MAG TPA: TlpA family protein disulfide reductase [Lachnospiraceae bacterium]|nr:TlpA family protein disulfide reductase [Lachnospiraceae bacterium]